MSRETYQRLAERYLGRKLTHSDGIPAELIERAEKSLGLVLPAVVRDYYITCGRNDRFNRTHNFIRPLEAIAVEDGYLVFMDENQDVVSWGIPLADIAAAHPIVWQRNNTPPVEWYSEEKTWPELLTHMFGWYAEESLW
jgi:hypothetical protein